MKKATENAENTYGITRTLFRRCAILYSQLILSRQTMRGIKADAQEKAVYTNLVYIFYNADFHGSLRQNRQSR